jgi:hypothetical protein
VDTRKLLTLENIEPHTNHEDAVSVEGLEDLFQWASDMVADGADPRARRIREQKLRRNVLDIIQRNKEIEAREKYSEEINYLQKRVIALLQILSEKMDESNNLKHVVVTQYFAMSKLAQLEDEVKQLQSMTWYRDEAEAERKHLMDALSKLKKERDFLDELLTANEIENGRLAKSINQVYEELNQLKNRKWWHYFVSVFRKLQTVSLPS